MLSNKTRTVMSLATTMLATLGANAASAAPVKEMYGAGSSLVAPYFRQAADCYALNEDLIFSGTPPTTSSVRRFNYTGKPALNCAKDNIATDTDVFYMSTGSGTGIRGVFSHDPSQLGDTSKKSGIQLFPEVDFALAETALGATEVGYYNNGNTEVVGGGSVAVTVVAPGASPAAGQYKNPRESYGALIQVPVLISPVVIAFDPVYKKVRNADGTITAYSFNLFYKRADGSGGLHLTQELVCAIFNGDITDWNDKRITASNKGKSLKAAGDPDKFDVPMQIVGREDSSGTSSLWTRYLAKSCENYSGNSYTDATTRMPGSYTDSTGTVRTTATGNKDLAGALYLKANDNTAPEGETLGSYTLAGGNDGVAKYIDFTVTPDAAAGSTKIQGRIGYLGPDYTLPAVLFTGTNKYNLMTADVKNKAGKYTAPTAAATLASFGSILPPDTDSKGKYKPSSDGDRSRKNPQDWVEPAKKASALANPSAKFGYPIIGTSNFIGYTCYADKDTRGAVQRFMNFFVTNPVVADPALGILAKSGFAAMPSAWQTAISETFFDGKDPDGLNLKVATAGSGKQCPSDVPGA